MASDVHYPRTAPGAKMIVTWCGLVGGHAKLATRINGADCGKCIREARRSEGKQ